MAYTNSPLELAKTIAGMSYADLRNVADELVQMNDPEAGGDRDINTRQGMADTLADWAQAQVEEAEEQARVAKLSAGKAA